MSCGEPRNYPDCARDCPLIKAAPTYCCRHSWFVDEYELTPAVVDLGRGMGGVLHHSTQGRLRALSLRCANCGASQALTGENHDTEKYT